MYKALLLSAIIAIGAVSADTHGKLLSQKETANVVQNSMLTVDYVMEGDINYKVSLPEFKAIINWNPTDTQNGMRNFMGIELSSYLNFTV